MTILRKILRAGVNVQDKAPKIRSRSNAWEKPIPPAPSTVACLRHMKETNLLEPEGSLHHPPAHCPPPSPPPGLMGPPSCLPIKGLSRKPSTPLPHSPTALTWPRCSHRLLFLPLVLAPSTHPPYSHHMTFAKCKISTLLALTLQLLFAYSLED